MIETELQRVIRDAQFAADERGVETYVWASQQRTGSYRYFNGNLPPLSTEHYIAIAPKKGGQHDD